MSKNIKGDKTISALTLNQIELRVKANSLSRSEIIN